MIHKKIMPSGLKAIFILAGILAFLIVGLAVLYALSFFISPFILMAVVGLGYMLLVAWLFIKETIDRGRGEY